MALTLTYTAQYCGGARPTPEIEAEAAAPKPYANKTLMFVSAKGRVDSAKTNNDGVLKIKLKKGDYQVFESWRYYLYTPEDLPIDVFDKDCLKLEWVKALYQIKVGRKKNNFTEKYQIEKTCAWNAPCLNNAEVPPGRQ